MCNQERLISLSKSLKEKSVALEESNRKLQVERQDAAAYRELCIRKENTDTAVKSILEQMSSLGVQSKAMSNFTGIIRETMEGLHARIVELETENSKLKREMVHGHSFKASEESFIKEPIVESVTIAEISSSEISGDLDSGIWWPNTKFKF